MQLPQPPQMFFPDDIKAVEHTDRLPESDDIQEHDNGSRYDQRDRYEARIVGHMAFLGLNSVLGVWLSPANLMVIWYHGIISAIGPEI